MKKCLILLAVLALVGCEEDDAASRFKAAPSVQQLPDDFYSVPVQEEVIEVEPEVEPEVPHYGEAFDVDIDNSPVEREVIAAERRGRRLAKLKAYAKHKPVEKEEIPIEWDETQKDFQRFEKTPQEVSSYPVDNDYILTRDVNIVGLLRSPIYSQLGGRIVIAVEKDIVSDNLGKVLIPMHSNIICDYKPLGSVGQDRLPLKCHRIITPPPGRMSIQLGAYAADQMGRTGLIGDVDNRFLQKYGGAVAMSLVSVMPYMLIKDKKNSNVNVSNVQNYQAESGGHPAAKALSKNLTEVTSRILKENIDINRTISIPRGTRVIVRPNHDILIRPPVQKNKPSERAEAVPVKEVASDDAPKENDRWLD